MAPLCAATPWLGTTALRNLSWSKQCLSCICGPRGICKTRPKRKTRNFKFQFTCQSINQLCSYAEFKRGLKKFLSSFLALVYICNGMQYWMLLCASTGGNPIKKILS